MRGRNKDGTWRRKRSDAGETRGSRNVDPKMRCKDAAHRPDFRSLDEKWWCVNAKSFRFFEGKGLLYPDGRSINWLRVCDLSDKVVVHNKKCDCDYTPPRRDDDGNKD